ncbi:MAG: PEP-CTERM sorting domain-containing protein [Candidatus Acidiferrales bacterium]
MRFKTLAAILFLFLSTALTASATGVAPKSKSDFGPTGLIDVGSSGSSGGATLQLVCQSSTGCSTTGDGDFLEVEIPFGLTPGELLDINGVDTTQPVWLDCDDSFIGPCPGGVLNPTQSSCVTSIGGTALSPSTYQVAIPSSCSLFTTGTFIDLVLGLSSPTNSLASFSVTPASATAPEPASWMLLAAGVVALLFKRRAIAGASVAS